MRILSKKLSIMIPYQDMKNTDLFLGTAHCEVIALMSREKGWFFQQNQGFPRGGPFRGCLSGDPFFCFGSDFGRSGRVNSIDESVTKLCPPRVGRFDVGVRVLTGLMKVWRFCVHSECIGLMSVKNLCPPRDYGNDVGGRVVCIGWMSGNADRY